MYDFPGCELATIERKEVLDVIGLFFNPYPINMKPPIGVSLLFVLHSVTRQSFKIPHFMSSVQRRVIFLFLIYPACSVVIKESKE